MNRTRWLLLLAGLVGLVAGLVAHFPAAHALAFVPTGDARLAGVHGSVWDGGVERVDVDAWPPVAVRWDIAFRHLFLGRLAGTAEFDVAGGAGRAEFALAGDGLRVSGARFAAAAAGIARHLPVPLLLVEGDVAARVEHAALRDDGNHSVEARVRWDRAAVRAPLDIELGAATLAVAPAGDGHELTIDARDGDVRVRGGGRLEADGRWHIELRAVPAADAPSAFVDILGDVGRRDGDAYVIRESGRLAR